MEKETQITKQLKTELKSKDENELLKTLKKVKSKGNDQILTSLFDVFSNTEHSIVKEEIKTILGELKTSTCTPILIEGLKTEDKLLQEVILSSLWSSGLNPKEYLPEIITTACNGSYMGAFEALTTIENLESPFDEEKITEAKLILNDYFSQPEDDKREIIKTILSLVNEMDESLEA